MFQKLLVAIDNSELSKHAFDEAIALAQRLDAEVLLVYVMSPTSEGYPDPILTSADAVYSAGQVADVELYLQRWQMFEEQGAELLKRLQAEAGAAGVVVELAQPFGDPGHAICTLAHSWEADLIVMGRRGFTGLKELFIGSVSNYVTHHAPCAVLTVPAPEAASRRGAIGLS